jgi:tripartite-type tricarboxylate transporter receptor subunit TctC
LLNVPYKTTTGAITAIASGESDLMFLDVGSTRPHWQSGKVRPVAVTSSTRMPSMAHVPTMKEEGAAEYDLTAWFAAYAPAKTPPDVVATMREMLATAMKSRGFLDQLEVFSMEPLELSGTSLTDLNRREIDMWTKVAQSQNIKPGN